MNDTTRVLVVANRTADSPELLESLRRRAEEGGAEFTLLLPATAHGLAWAADMHAGDEEATSHLEGLAERMREVGVNVREAKVGASEPLAAVCDECNMGSYDELILSTLPLHLSKWLRLDLPSKARAATGLPVTHVVAHSADRPVAKR